MRTRQNDLLSSFTPLFLLLAATTLTGCIAFFPDPARSGSIYIDDPVMAKELDEQGNPIEPTTTFKTSDKRIYCTISVRGPENVRLGARWYYGDKLIFDDVIYLGTQRRGAWYLERVPGKVFPPGDYRIEIYLIEKPNKVVTFKVIE